VIVTILLLLYTVTIKAQKTEEFAFITIKGKFFSKKLKTRIDFGEGEEAIKKSEKFESDLKDAKSFVTILNYMSEAGYEMDSPNDFIGMYHNTWSKDMYFIMKTKRE